MTGSGTRGTGSDTVGMGSDKEGTGSETVGIESDMLTSLLQLDKHWETMCQFQYKQY